MSVWKSYICLQASQVLNTQNDNRMPPPEVSKNRKPIDSSIAGTDVKDVKKMLPKQYTFSPEEKKVISRLQFFCVTS